MLRHAVLRHKVFILQCCSRCNADTTLCVCVCFSLWSVAVELAMIMDRLYGGVCYAGIDTDPELKYPKGAGRVAFSNQQSYIAAISARFVQLQHGEIDKRVRKGTQWGGGGGQQQLRSKRLDQRFQLNILKLMAHTANHKASWPTPGWKDAITVPAP